MTIKTLIITIHLVCKSYQQGHDVHIDLTVPETNSVMKALYKAPIPYEETDPIIHKIREQVLPQIKNDSSLIN